MSATSLITVTPIVRKRENDNTIQPMSLKKQRNRISRKSYDEEMTSTTEQNLQPNIDRIQYSGLVQCRHNHLIEKEHELVDKAVRLRPDMKGRLKDVLNMSATGICLTCGGKILWRCPLPLEECISGWIQFDSASTHCRKHKYYFDTLPHEEEEIDTNCCKPEDKSCWVKWCKKCMKCLTVEDDKCTKLMDAHPELVENCYYCTDDNADTIVIDTKDETRKEVASILVTQSTPITYASKDNVEVLQEEMKQLKSLVAIADKKIAKLEETKSIQVPHITTMTTTSTNKIIEPNTNNNHIDCEECKLMHTAHCFEYLGKAPIGNTPIPMVKSFPTKMPYMTRKIIQDFPLHQREAEYNMLLLNTGNPPVNPKYNNEIDDAREKSVAKYWYQIYPQAKKITLVRSTYDNTKIALESKPSATNLQ